MRSAHVSLREAAAKQFRSNVGACLTKGNGLEMGYLTRKDDNIHGFQLPIDDDITSVIGKQLGDLPQVVRHRTHKRKYNRMVGPNSRKRRGGTRGGPVHRVPRVRVQFVYNKRSAPGNGVM